MVLGSTREQPNVADYLIDGGAVAYTWETWQIERGPLRWEGGADLAGGFPGFASRGGRLEGVQLRLTDRYLLADEGRQHGFGLPLSWLLGADLVPSGRIERPEPTLRVCYSDGAHVRTFQARFRGSLLSPRGRRAEQALAALAALGLLQAGEALPPEPELGLSWEEAARFEGENVIWSGRSSAVLGLGGDRVACDVWLTTRSIIWGSNAGEGILRLPLGAILDVVPADLTDRARTPAVFVATGDRLGGRHDFPFIFDRHSPAQRNLRERGAFLVGLRSRGIALGAPGPLPQPWRGAVAPALPEPFEASPQPRLKSQRPAPTGRFRPRPLPSHSNEPVAPGRWERAMMEWTGQMAAAESPAVAPESPDEAIVRDRLTALLGPEDAAGDAPSSDDRSARGVIVPWPGTERANRRRAGEGGTVGAVETPPADPAPPAIEPIGGGGSPTASAGAVDGYDGAVEPADDLFSGTWPIPAGFLGEVVAERFAARSLPATLGSESATIGGTGFAGPLAEPPAASGAPADSTAPAAADGMGEVAPEAASSPRTILRAYEEALLRAITGTLRAIEDRLAGGMAGHPSLPLPTPAERGAAFAALDGLVAAGELPAQEAEVHRALLTAAGEAGPRLRSLLELRDAGYLPDGELDRKRREIAAPLAALLSR
jgi:hypothetical protein